MSRLASVPLVSPNRGATPAAARNLAQERSHPPTKQHAQSVKQAARLLRGVNLLHPDRHRRRPLSHAIVPCPLDNPMERPIQYPG